MKKFDFEITVNADPKSGEIIAVYFKFRKGKATEVKEFENGAAFDISPVQYSMS